jgi:hypothetical protein
MNAMNRVGLQSMKNIQNPNKSGLALINFMFIRRRSEMIFGRFWKYEEHTEKNLSISPIYIYIKHGIFHVRVIRLDKKLLFSQTRKFYHRTHKSLVLHSKIIFPFALTSLKRLCSPGVFPSKFHITNFTSSYFSPIHAITDQSFTTLYVGS